MVKSNTTYKSCDSATTRTNSLNCNTVDLLGSMILRVLHCYRVARVARHNSIGVRDKKSSQIQAFSSDFRFMFFFNLQYCVLHPVQAPGPLSRIVFQVQTPGLCFRFQAPGKYSGSGLGARFRLQAQYQGSGTRFRFPAAAC